MNFQANPTSQLLGMAATTSETTSQEFRLGWFISQANNMLEKLIICCCMNLLSLKTGGAFKHAAF
jgi:hypothetical protein